MGNANCCCRGRDKTPEDSKMDETGTALNNKSLTSNKYKPRESMTPEKSYAGETTRSVDGPPESAPEEGNRMMMPESSSSLLMSNFDSFGGNSFKGEDNPQENKPTRRGFNNSSIGSKGNLNPNNSMNSQSSNNLKSGMNNIEGNNSQKISKIFLRITIENLEIIYKTFEDFGLLFRPFLEIIIENTEPIKVFPSQGDGDLDKSFNNSVLSNLSDTSMQLNSSLNMRSGNSFLAGKEKSYAFKYVKNFEIQSSDFYSNIKFKIKNNMPKSNYNNVNSLPPLISIGEAKIQVNKLFKEYKENSFDGNLEIKLRNSILVGYLKVILTVSEKSSLNHDDAIDKMAKPKSNTLMDDVSSTSQNNLFNLWEYNYLNYDEIDSNTLDRYFMLEYDKKYQILNFSKNIPRHIPGENKDNYDHRDLFRDFTEAYKTQNSVAIYQILIIFVKLTNKDEFKMIGEFFKLLTEYDKNNLVEYCKNCNDNPFIIKLYLIFFNNYMKYFKNNKSITIRNNKEIEDIVLIKNTIELIVRFMDKVKNMFNSSEVRDEMRDCIIWCLNLLYQLISSPAELNSNGNKDQNADQKKKELNVIYENCLQIIYKRIYILKILDANMGDSEIVGSIFRIFRKIVQVLTTDNPNSFDMTRMHTNPKEFSAQFRKIIIEQNEGIFFTTLKIILSKYHHYTELHVNILIITYQLTNYCDINSLIWAAEKLNLTTFKETFDFYRGRLRNFNKLINTLHLNILSNFSDIAKNKSDDSYFNLMKLMSIDIKSFYKISQTYKKRLDDFRIKKKNEFEIHEIITRIGANITKYPNNSVLLMEGFFFDDIIEYLIIIGVAEFNDNESNNSNNNSGDYISKIKERKKKMDLEEIKKIVLSIVENSLVIIYNIMGCSNEISDPFSNKLAEHDITSADDLFELIGLCKNLLLKNGINVEIVDMHFTNIKNLFD